MSDYKRITQHGGCGRCYVLISGDRKTKNAVKKACQAAGRKWMGAGMGEWSNSIYIGYDNATSTQWSQAEQVAQNLKELGISAYADGWGD
jgi:hypothetical protein